MIRRVQRWLMRRRLMRRLPSLGGVERIVVMCTANRVRSPFAGKVLERLLPEGITVVSRGVLDSGHPCPPEAVTTAQKYDVDLSAHRSVAVASQELLHADLVLTMELRMAHELVVRYPGLSTKIAPLGAFDPHHYGLYDIEDPYLLPPSEYQHSYALIARCCEELAGALLDERGRRSAVA